MYPPPTFIIILQLFVSILFVVTPISLASNHIRHLTTTKVEDGDHSLFFCESWRFSVETNNAGNWSIPVQCFEYMKKYMTGDRYKSDLDLAARNALEFAKSVDMAGDGLDAWVFDIDETLLSSLPYYETHGFKETNRTEHIEWGQRHKSPALPANLRLYNEIRQLGFTIFLLTGRPEWYRNQTVTNLLYTGYSHWERLLLRQPYDEGKKAIDYKSENRKQLEDEGYRIHGSSGDQWSDLLGYAIARRSFKYPNIMYYVA